MASVESDEGDEPEPGPSGTSAGAAKFASALAWVPRGVPAAHPTRVAVPKAKLRKLVRGRPGDADSPSSGSENDNSGTAAPPTIERGVGAVKHDNAVGEDANDDDQLDERYQLDGYEHEDDTVKVSLQGTAALGPDDPLLDSGNQSADDDKHSSDDDDDFMLRPDDNYLVLAKVIKDEFTLDAYVFNSTDDDFYVHHDYPLSGPALCMQRVGYDPGADPSASNAKGNLLAVGTMGGQVQLWDLDVINAVEPVVTLGDPGPLKRKKQCDRTMKKLQHKEAVCCLSWNEQREHILASGSADHTVLLWDLDAAAPNCRIRAHECRVSAMQWHPQEEAMLLTCGAGAVSDRRPEIAMWDCRYDTKKPVAGWNLPTPAGCDGGEVESCVWLPANLFLFAAGADNGTLAVADSRKPTALLHCKSDASSVEAIESLCCSSKVPDLLVTAGGGDGAVAFWQFDSQKGPEVVTTHNAQVGRIHDLAMCPDVPVLGVAGQNNGYVKTIDLTKIDKVREALHL